MLSRKSGSVVFLVLVYLAAFAVGFFVYRISSALGQLWAMLIADVVATVFVWLIGIIFKNSSVYDPYWSVAPPVIAIAWMVILKSYTLPTYILILALLIWSIRLTLNFLVGWPGMVHQDWRYGMLKEKSPKLWILTNLFGINMFPTLIVFVCMIPAFYVIESGLSITFWTYVGFVLCLTAVVLQVVADGQMREFKKTRKSGEHIETGLWKHSRHPNYLGEVILWWGVWVMQIGLIPSLWVTVFAPIAMTAMFLFASVPMMENYMKAKCPGYEDYKKRVSMFIPMPERKK